MRQTFRARHLLHYLLSGLGLLPLAAAAADPSSLPAIAIIIDDIGNSLELGNGSLELPGPVTLSVLPHTPYSVQIAERAHHGGKEVMLHLPMEADRGLRLGPGGIHRKMSHRDLKLTVRKDIDSVPYVKGINNHMGSRLTEDRQAMDWVMQALHDQGGELFFIDSRTSHHTVAERMASTYKIRNTGRDVFLDNDRRPSAIRKQFQELLELAHLRGAAVGIGHPHPETIEVLREELARLDESQVRLVAASELIQIQAEISPWSEPSSPSPTVAKNSKP